MKINPGMKFLETSILRRRKRSNILLKARSNSLQLTPPLSLLLLPNSTFFSKIFSITSINVVSKSILSTSNSVAQTNDFRNGISIATATATATASSREREALPPLIYTISSPFSPISNRLYPPLVLYPLLEV
tara:strand:+ start:280 stop:675 length:396 start_codon:yes stop_codon:yes gene_type:complete